MNGAHALWQYVPVKNVPPPPEIKAKLQALREEFAKRVQELKRTGLAR